MLSLLSFPLLSHFPRAMKKTITKQTSCEQVVFAEKMPGFNETTQKISTRPSNDNTGGCGGKKNRIVRFDRVEIRTYAVILGDNPGGRCGAPLSLSWEYDLLGHLPVESFERERVHERRHGQRELWLDKNRRQYILSKAAYKDSQISQAEKDAQGIRYQRRSSYYKSVIHDPSSLRPKRAKVQHDEQQPNGCSHLACLKVFT